MSYSMSMEDLQEMRAQKVGVVGILNSATCDYYHQALKEECDSGRAVLVGWIPNELGEYLAEYRETGEMPINLRDYLSTVAGVLMDHGVDAIAVASTIFDDAIKAMQLDLSPILISDFAGIHLCDEYASRDTGLAVSLIGHQLVLCKSASLVANLTELDIAVVGEAYTHVWRPTGRRAKAEESIDAALIAAEIEASYEKLSQLLEMHAGAHLVNGQCQRYTTAEMGSQGAMDALMAQILPLCLDDVPILLEGAELAHWMKRERAQKMCEVWNLNLVSLTDLHIAAIKRVLSSSVD